MKNMFRNLFKRKTIILVPLGTKVRINEATRDITIIETELIDNTRIIPNE